MAHELIRLDEYPELAKHYDENDEGHTRGHYEHLVSLYDLSLEYATTEDEKNEIKQEKKRFLELVEESDTEYFALVD